MCAQYKSGSKIAMELIVKATFGVTHKLTSFLIIGVTDCAQWAGSPIPPPTILLKDPGEPVPGAKQVSNSSFIHNTGASVIAGVLHSNPARQQQ